MIANLLLTGLLLTQAPVPAAPPPAPPAPTLSELHQAQMDAHLLRVKTLQLEIQLQQIALTEQRTALDKAITAAHPGWQMDWTKGVLVPAKKDAGQ